MPSPGPYGKVIERLNGSGRLIHQAAVIAGCPFEAQQYSDGRIYITCKLHLEYQEDEQSYRDRVTGNNISQSHLDTIDRMNGTFAFRGETDNGYLVETMNAQIVSNETTGMFGYTNIELDIRLRCANLEIMSATRQELKFIRFRLVNFVFIGTEKVPIAREDGFDIDWQLPLIIDDLAVLIQPSRDYESVIDELEATRGIDITCEAVVAVSSERELASIREKVESLCVLLSLARGTLVTWLNYVVVSETREIQMAGWRDSITKKFSIRGLIHKRGATTKAYVETAYANLPMARARWNIDHIIQAFVDAIAEGDFLEFRALKMSICMELLRGAFLVQKERVYVVNPHSEFIYQKDELKDRVLTVLSELFKDERRDRLELMATHVQGFNYYPFRRALSEMCEELHVKANSKQRSRLIDIRNHLVHYGLFDPNLGAPWDQFQDLGRFVGNCLLAILGYSLETRHD